MEQSKTMLPKILLFYFINIILLSTLCFCQEFYGSHERGVSDTSNRRINLYDIDRSINSRNDYYSGEDYSSYSNNSEAVKLAYEKQYKAYISNLNMTNRKISSPIRLGGDRKPHPVAQEETCVTGSCHSEENTEQSSAESFKAHLLMKLGFDHEPNNTRFPKLTDGVRIVLCRSFNISADHCLNYRSTPPPEEDYQSDDPMAFYTSDYQRDESTVIDENFRFMSYENRIYAYSSTTIKPRHKTHLIFQFSESQLSNNAVVSAKLKLYMNSQSYLNANNIIIPEGTDLIDIEVAKILDDQLHKKIFNTFHNISLPKGETNGAYLQLDLTDLVSEWFSSQKTIHGIALKFTLSKTGLVLPHKIVVLDSSDFARRPFIDILPSDQRKYRLKRSSPRCQKGTNENRCCRHELTVDFDQFGWDWIIAPKTYDANYCAGECKIAFLQQYAHTHVMQLSAAASPCCSPRKMTSMQLLYFDSKLNIVLGTIPNMIVEECFCS